jgi:predicted ArsR family transcriptional regulator
MADKPAGWHGVHRALADPLRIRIVEGVAERPRSAAELAEFLGMPADRLYYHLGQLERAALIEVVQHRRLARGKVERVYALAQVEPPGDDADPEEMAAFLGSVLEATRLDIVAAHQAGQDGRHRAVNVYRGSVRLTEQGLGELRERIQQLIDTYAQDDSSGGAVWTRLLVTTVDLQDRPTDKGETP